MSAEWWAGAVPRPVWFADEPPLFVPGRPLGWVLHVAVGNGSLFGYFNSLQPPNRKVSTLWVGKDGRVEQYMPATREPWAQVAGNPDYWAVETEGYPTEPLTDAQILSLARWHVWSGTADKPADAPGMKGIGTHSMGGAPWGGHACPGDIRAGQRQAILTLAAHLRYQTPNTLETPMFLARIAGGRTYYMVTGDGHRVALAVWDDVLALRAAGIPDAGELSAGTINAFPPLAP